jgi:ferric-dicitrate binding protein FerR (iron transport regulator)
MHPPRSLTVDSEARDDEWIVRYIAGECSPQESARIQRWIAADPARWERFQALEQVWRVCGKESLESGEGGGVDAGSGRWNAESALALLRESLDPAARRAEEARAGQRAPWVEEQYAAERAPRRMSVAPLTLHGSASRWWGAGGRGRSIAAGLALVVACVAGWWTIVRRSPAREGATAAETLPLREVATARGQRATITLSDGTRIILGPASSVRYARDFGARARRDVYLDGQAYFEVVHDESHPFAVRTSKGVAEDIGTDFVVTSYSTTPGMQVVVASGQVSLRGAASPEVDSAAGRGRLAPPLMLGPGELGAIDSGGTIRRSRVSDASPYFDWTRGELAFHGVPLGEALPAIGRWYDVDITLGDQGLAKRRLVAEFGAQSAREVVRLIALAVDARYEWHGDAVVLLPRR